jgi:medium-chain acyl-[acyl-carrier-protein] hydrolase
VGAWIVGPRLSPDARLRLFCFPYGGAGASLYRGWSAALPATVAVCPVQLPGRENRLAEPSFRRLQPLVQALADGLTPHLDVPFALFGHSLGALVSFELARELRRRGRYPASLLVSSFRAPHLPDPDPPIYHLPDAEFIQELVELGGTPPEVLENAELMELVLPRLRADLEVCDTYAYLPETPLACPIAVFGGVDDQEVRPEELAGWREHTSGAFRLRLFTGDHFYVHSMGGALQQAVAEELMRVLTAAQPR